MRRSLALSALTLLALLPACVGEDPVISTGALGGDDDGADADPAHPDAAPGSPDAAPGSPDAATTGMPEKLTVSFTTTSNGGKYAPRNVVAVWIENSGGSFQKTIGRWAGTRKSRLVGWVQKAGSADIDAVSGATRQSHAGTLTVTWDFKNKQGQAVPDGTYTIRMELADSNATSTTQNHEGTFSFDKNGTAATQNTAGGGFNAVSISYSGR